MSKYAVSPKIQIFNWKTQSQKILLSSSSILNVFV